MTRKVKGLYSDLNVDGSNTEDARQILLQPGKKKRNKKTTYNDEKILAAIERYYKTLYTCTIKTHENDLNDFIELLDIRDQERDRMKGPTTLQERKIALDTFQTNKSPEEEGLTVEFYMYFIGLLGEDLVASFNAAYDANELSTSQRQGVITLNPKEDGSLLELSNWRAVTLLNVDCKIATKVILKRIELCWCIRIEQGLSKADILGKISD